MPFDPSHHHCPKCLKDFTFWDFKRHQDACVSTTRNDDMTVSPVDCPLCMLEFFACPMDQMKVIEVAREEGQGEAVAWFLDQYADIHNEHSEGGDA